MNPCHPLRLIWSAAFIALIILSPVHLPRQLASTDLEPDLQSRPSVIRVTADINPDFGCLHIIPRHLPGCRRELLLYFIRYRLETHLRFDPQHWAMPLYLAFDEADQWQQVSLFCLHLTRRPS